MKRTRRGFTMIEILVAIAIILILIGIGVVGYRALDKKSSTDATRVTMNAGNAMLVEYEKGSSLSNLGALAQGAPVSFADIAPGGGDRARAIQNCQAVLARLLVVPANKNWLSQIPVKAQIPATAPLPPAMADGWGNPIVFVPRDGLAGVKNGDQSNVLVKSPDGRPFWASGGPDGALTTGDDNVYSFER